MRQINAPTRTFTALICVLAVLACGAGAAAALSVGRGQSYWLVSSRGQVFAFGKARYYGSEAGKRFRGEIVGIVGTPDGKGYWLISSIGVRFPFGDAHLYRYRSTKLQKLTGRASVRHLRGKIVGVAVAKLRAAKPGSTTAPSTNPAATTPTTTSVAGGSSLGALTVTSTSLPVAADPYPYSATLAASGGTPSYAWLLVSGSLPPGLSLQASGAISGTPTQTGTYPIIVEVTDAAGDTATATVSITVDLGAENWSGYAEQDASGGTSGPAYTGAGGTFTVPSLNSSDAAGEYLAEWVGVDGYDNANLIQAGVELNSNGGGGETIQPWWEILPATETPITTMSVSAGDRVSVTLRRTATTCTITQRHAPSEAGYDWTIALNDLSHGNDSFTTTQCYAGAGDSAEWIVEAPEVGAGVSTLAPFAPAIGFSSISSSQAYTSLDDLVIVNNAYQIVATPSPLDANGFTVAYGDNVPPAP